MEDASCAKFEIPALECASWDSAAPVADGEGPPRYMKVPNPFNEHPTLWPGAFDVRWIYDTTCTPAVKNAMCAVRMKPFSKCCEVGLTKEGELPGGLPEKNRRRGGWRQERHNNDVWLMRECDIRRRAPSHEKLPGVGRKLGSQIFGVNVTGRQSGRAAPRSTSSPPCLPFPLCSRPRLPRLGARRAKRTL